MAALSRSVGESLRMGAAAGSASAESGNHRGRSWSRLHRTDDEVRQKVNRLRPMYLTRSAKKGVPGGSLTEISIGLLAELDIEPGSDHVVHDHPGGA